MLFGVLNCTRLDQTTRPDSPAMTIPNTEAPNLSDLPLDVPKYERQTSLGDLLNDVDQDLPPLRMGATRVPERLSASTSRLEIGSSLSGHRRKSLPDFLKSRSKSPSGRLLRDDSSVSSRSSIDMDSDILTDRMGMEDLNSSVCSATREQLHASVSSLPAVHERLSDETLEDVHAFSDVSRANSSRGNSVAASSDVGSLYLDTLEEEGEDENDGGVMISNMENLTIHEECDEKEEYESPCGGDDTVPTV